MTTCLALPDDPLLVLESAPLANKGLLGISSFFLKEKTEKSPH